MTPSARTLQQCRDEGYLVEVVERWVPFSQTRKDLFGFIDIVCLRGSSIVGIQATSRSNVSARVKKIRNECGDQLQAWTNAGGVVEVWGWGKMKKRDSDGKLWQVRIISVK